jgi:hypothetical protein
MRKDTSIITEEISSKIAISLITLKKLSSIDKLKNNKVISRKRYSQLVCLMFGFLAKHLEILNEKEKYEAMQYSVWLLNYSLNKAAPDFFIGIDFKPDEKAGHSQLNADICKWYITNFNNKSVMAISITGLHLFLLTANKNSISNQDYEYLKKAGTLLPRDAEYNVFSVISDIFINSEKNLETGY